jgi:hypothetical protein
MTDETGMETNEITINVKKKRKKKKKKKTRKTRTKRRSGGTRVSVSTCWSVILLVTALTLMYYAWRRAESHEPDLQHVVNVRTRKKRKNKQAKTKKQKKQKRPKRKTKCTCTKKSSLLLLSSSMWMFDTE